MQVKRRLTVIAGVVVLLSAGLFGSTSAFSDVVDDVVYDIQNCTVDAFDPVYNSSTDTVQGSAQISNCRFYLGFTVCLDYNGAIYQPSCKDYSPPATSGTTKNVQCLPGLWATTLILKGNSNAGGYLGRHSFPPILFTCIPPTEP